MRFASTSTSLVAILVANERSDFVLPNHPRSEERCSPLWLLKVSDLAASLATQAEGRWSRWEALRALRSSRPGLPKAADESAFLVVLKLGHGSKAKSYPQ